MSQIELASCVTRLVEMPCLLNPSLRTSTKSDTRTLGFSTIHTYARSEVLTGLTWTEVHAEAATATEIDNKTKRTIDHGAPSTNRNCFVPSGGELLALISTPVGARHEGNRQALANQRVPIAPAEANSCARGPPELDFKFRTVFNVKLEEGKTW